MESVEQWVWERAGNTRARTSGDGHWEPFSHLSSLSGTPAIPSIHVSPILTPKKSYSIHRMIPRLSVYMVRLSAFPLGAAFFFYVLRDSTPGHHIGSQYFLRTVVVLFYILWYVCLMFGLESGTR